MNCFDRGPEELHILSVPNLGELVLNQEELKKIVNEKHPNSGFISTHFAAISRNYKVLRFVISLGAKVNELDSQQQTPLMKALRFKPLDKESLRKQKKCVNILLKAGADPHRKDVHSLTASDYAKRNGVEFLAELIANENGEEEHRYSDAPTDFEEIYADIKKKKQVFEKKDRSQDDKEKDQIPTRIDSFDHFEEENIPHDDTSFEEVDIEEFEKRQSRCTSINTEKTDSSWVKAEGDLNSKTVQNRAAQLVKAMKGSEEIDSLLSGLDCNMPYNGTPLGFHVLQALVPERYGYLTTLIDHGFDVNGLDCDNRHLVEYFLDELEFGSLEDLEFMQVIGGDVRIEWKKKVSMGENLYEKLWKTPGKRAYELRESLNSEFRALQIHGKLPFKERPIPAMSRTKGIHEQVRKRNHEAVTSILVERPSVITSRDWKLYATPLHIAAELRMLNTIKNMLSPTIITFTEAVINSQDCFGCTPIMRLFIQPQAQVHTSPNKNAATNSKLTAEVIESCRMMLDLYKIDLNIQDCDKNTAFHYLIDCISKCIDKSWFALYKDALRLVEDFMRKGADYGILNNLDESPLSIAQNSTNPNKNLIRILETYDGSDYKGSPWSTPKKKSEKGFESVYEKW
ncbi:unnamed protein product [Oikopleura dioica]|uniref:Uncharacterized protein n=1 Tax=Oikopleura dioica TaxID=34765 RepID=E4YFI2_OIKDI|nr:unnamed protein product [Oikopleura dioica]